MLNFYETLDIAMKQNGITAAEMSRKTGLYKSYFSELKSGRTKDVSWKNALLIIDALGMTPNEFWELQKSR